MNKKSHGFTLIELLVVVGIIALLIGIALPNYVNSRARARDAKKKQELAGVKTALRLYYNDYSMYPASAGGLNLLTGLKGCGTTGTSACPSAGCGVDFSAGGAAGCDNVYMKKFPATYSVGNLQYVQTSFGNDFRLYVMLENPSDPDLATSQATCPSAGGANCTGSTYCVCGD